MKLKFLCIAHRQELAIKSSYAVRFWQNEFDAAKSFFEQGLWNEAVCHAGYAYETAEILISNGNIDYEVSCDWFCHSTLLVTEIFSCLGYPNKAKEILGLAISRFKQESNVSTSKSTIVSNCLNRLYSYGSSDSSCHA